MLEEVVVVAELAAGALLVAVEVVVAEDGAEELLLVPGVVVPVPHPAASAAATARGRARRRADLRRCVISGSLPVGRRPCRRPSAWLRSAPSALTLPAGHTVDARGVGRAAAEGREGGAGGGDIGPACRLLRL